MEEIESPVEKTQEDLHEHAHGAKEPWIGKVALTAAILAVIAALSASVSSHHESEGMLEQMQASDHWAFFQAKGIKSAILKASHPENEKEIARYEEEQKEIKVEATKEQESSRHSMKTHTLFSRCATFAQIGIAIAAVSVLTKRKAYWFFSLACGVAGLVFGVMGFLS